MSIWKEIKHALNSTLGTDSFQPLDQYLRSTQTINATSYTELIINTENGTDNALYIGQPIIFCKPDKVSSFQEYHPNYRIIDSSVATPVTLFKIKMLTSGSIIIGDIPRHDKVEKGWYINRDDDWYNVLELSVKDKIYVAQEIYGAPIYYQKGDIIHLYIAEFTAGMRSDDIGNELIFTPCIYGKITTTSSIEYLNWEDVSE